MFARIFFLLFLFLSVISLQSWWIPDGFYCTDCGDCSCQGSGIGYESCYSNPVEYMGQSYNFVSGVGSGSTCCPSAPYSICGKECPWSWASGTAAGPIGNGGGNGDDGNGQWTHCYERTDIPTNDDASKQIGDDHIQYNKKYYGAGTECLDQDGNRIGGPGYERSGLPCCMNCGFTLEDMLTNCPKCNQIDQQIDKQTMETASTDADWDLVFASYQTTCENVGNVYCNSLVPLYIYGHWTGDYEYYKFVCSTVDINSVWSKAGYDKLDNSDVVLQTLGWGCTLFNGPGCVSGTMDLKNSNGDTVKVADVPAAHRIIDLQGANYDSATETLKEENNCEVLASTLIANKAATYEGFTEHHNVYQDGNVVQFLSNDDNDLIDNGPIYSIFSTCEYIKNTANYAFTPFSLLDKMSASKFSIFYKFVRKFMEKLPVETRISMLQPSTYEKHYVKVANILLANPLLEQCYVNNEDCSEAAKSVQIFLSTVTNTAVKNSISNAYPEGIKSYAALMVENNNVAPQCLWDTGCVAGGCEKGAYCKEYQYWSQCLEDTNIATTNCISSQNGHGSTPHWGCKSDDDCCNTGAKCKSDGHCQLSCLYGVNNDPV